MSIHPAMLPTDVLLAECTVRRTKGSGPGGQHRNKVETAIVIEHAPTGVRGEASERRSQEQNRRMAIGRLRVRLALEVRSRRAGESFEPSDLWRSRVKGGRVQVSVEHDDFPALLAEALDALAVSSLDVKSAAETLLVSSSQLVKFLKVEPKAMRQVNQARAEQGAPPLK